MLMTMMTMMDDPMDDPMDVEEEEGEPARGRHSP
jgi:hypothetical protein